MTPLNCSSSFSPLCFVALQPISCISLYSYCSFLICCLQRNHLQKQKGNCYGNQTKKKNQNEKEKNKGCYFATGVRDSQLAASVLYRQHSMKISLGKSALGQNNRSSLLLKGSIRVSIHSSLNLQLHEPQITEQQSIHMQHPLLLHTS